MMKETHKLMFNPLTMDFKILPVHSSQCSYRGSAWTIVYTGTLNECESQKEKLSR